MRTRRTVAAATLLALIAAMLVYLQPAHAAVGLRVNGTRLVEANGSNLILRGVAHAHTWFPSQTSSFANIKSLGANSVRVVLSGGRWQPANGPADVANVITLCKNARLICVLENHDTTGFGEQGGAVSLDTAVNYWLSLQSVLTGQENYVIINIGNEPFGNNPVTPGWVQATSSAISRLRNAGFDHMLMVDAPNWGQDWQFVMRDNAATVFNADVDRNTVFAIHMYGVFDTAAEITDYMQRFQTAGLPLVVGEFGHNHSDGNPDEDTIMAQAQSRGLGYLGWSWSGNSGGVEYLDMVNQFNVNSLTPWGQRIFNGANGIASTAREATIYSGATTTNQQTTTTSQQTTTTTGPPGACRVAYVFQSIWQDGFVVQLRVTNLGSSAINGWTVRWSFNNNGQITNMWNASRTQSGQAVAATNLSYNNLLAANGGFQDFGFQAAYSGTAPTRPTTISLNNTNCTVA